MVPVLGWGHWTVEYAAVCSQATRWRAVRTRTPGPCLCSEPRRWRGMRRQQATKLMPLAATVPSPCLGVSKPSHELPKGRTGRTQRPIPGPGAFTQHGHSHLPLLKREGRGGKGDQDISLQITVKQEECARVQQHCAVTTCLLYYK